MGLAKPMTTTSLPATVPLPRDPDTDPETIAFHVRFLASGGADPNEEIDSVVVLLEAQVLSHFTPHTLRWAAARVAARRDMFLDFLDEPVHEESVREPETLMPVMQKPLLANGSTSDRNDNTAFGPTYRWGPLRMRAVRAGVPVHQPSHYNAHPCGFPASDLLDHLPFNLGNALKYCWRAPHKHTAPTDDLKKARWYFEREVERLAGRDRLDTLILQSQLKAASSLAMRVIAADPQSVLSHVLTSLYQGLRDGLDGLGLATIAMTAYDNCNLPTTP